MSYSWHMPNKRTFNIDPIRELIEDEVGDGLWIDPYAGDAKVADVTNDLNPDKDTDYNMKAIEFVEQFNESEVDGGILIDPPYSRRQIKECYESVGLEVDRETTQHSFWSDLKEKVPRILQPGAKAISFGWNSNGVGKTRGFTKTRILLTCHGAGHNDTITVVERYKGDADGGGTDDTEQTTLG